MTKVVGINRLRVNIAAFILIAAALFATSCNECCNRGVGYAYSSTYECEDTLSSFNIYIYARVSSKYSHNAMPIVIIVTTPLGKRYSDTLKLPLLERGVEAKKIESGMWRDFEWSYRREVLFSNKGKWRFTLKQERLTPAFDGVGQMGVRVSKSKE